MKPQNLLAALGCFCFWLTSLSAANKPNFIVIMADDMGYECLTVNGAEDYKTPVLDGLAASGMRFTQAFANPICTPSRVKIMTGLYNIRNYKAFGVLPRTETTFAHQLKKAGYATVIAGKWQLGRQIDAPTHFGFDESCLWQHTLRNRPGSKLDTRFENPLLTVNGKDVDYIDSNGKYAPDICADYICDFIKKNKEKPIFAYYPMILTHCPFTATPDSSDWDPTSKGSPSYKGPGTNEDKHRHFSDMVSYTDKLIGRIVKTLEETGLRENTMIVFTGDNGTDAPIVTNWNGGKVVGGKGKVQDTGTRVPFIVNWPGKIAANLNETELVEFSDIMPTLCELAGAPLPENYPGDGVSLWPTLSGEGERDKKHIYIWYNRSGKPGSGTAWARTVNYGVKMENKSGKFKYEKYDGHFKKVDVSLNSVPEKGNATLRNLQQFIEEMAAAYPVKESAAKEGTGKKKKGKGKAKKKKADKAA